jgi:4'-phosphopantetheinyl transferase EntD
VTTQQLGEIANALRRVLPAELIVEVTSEASVDALLPEEAAATRDWTPQRQLQFAAGRLCARRGLARIGCSPCPILFDTDGAPVWPPGVVGSISHKRQHCIAVIGRSSAVRSLGVDLERDIIEPAETEAEIARRVCGTASERRQASLLRGTVRSPGTLLLSAKEAFFKFQFPLTRTQLDWADVELRVEESQFQARATARTCVPNSTGVFAFAGGWLASVCF